VGADGTGHLTSHPRDTRNCSSSTLTSGRACTHTRPPSPAAEMRTLASNKGSVAPDPSEEAGLESLRATSSAISSTSMSPRSKPPEMKRGAIRLPFDAVQHGDLVQHGQQSLEWRSLNGHLLNDAWVHFARAVVRMSLPIPCRLNTTKVKE
jgi:hypothetical protein